MVNTDELELILDPQHPSLDDERFAPQILNLLNLLKQEVGGVKKSPVAEPGKRGGLPQIVLALGTSGAIGGAIAVMKAWLDRDNARKISIRIRGKGKSNDIEITADAANIRELEKLLVAARKQ